MFRLFTFFIVTYFCLLSTNLFAQNSKIEGVLESLENQTSLQEGDIFKAKLMILPLETVINSELSNALKKGILMGYFRVVDIQSIKFSENNSEVLEVYLSLILVTEFKKQEFYIWSYKGLNIPFVFKNIMAIKNLSQIKEFLIHDQLEKKENIYIKYYITLIIFVVLILLLILNKLNLKRRLKFSLNEKRTRSFEKWNNIIFSASGREEFERIYVCRNEWTEFIEVNSSTFDEFIYEMKKNMYQENWDEEIESNISNIVGKFKKHIGKKWK